MREKYHLKVPMMYFNPLKNNNHNVIFYDMVNDSFDDLKMFLKINLLTLYLTLCMAKVVRMEKFKAILIN